MRTDYSCFLDPADNRTGVCKPDDNIQGASTTTEHVPIHRGSSQVLIHARSDPGNSTPNQNATEDSFKPYSLHFLTNCQWSLENKTERCTRPWDFVKYTIGIGSQKVGSSSWSSPFRLKRDAVDSDASGPLERYRARKERVRKNRHGFSIIHLIGCVLVILSFLCTAISFIILPALGKWISVGNLFLATLATIFLLTSSIFTAVLAKQTTDFFAKDKFASRKYTAQSGGKFQALV